MTSRAEQLQDMALECRVLANTIANKISRQQLLEVAARFEWLAQHFRLPEIRTLARLKPER
jgi:hypothetical protein